MFAQHNLTYIKNWNFFFYWMPDAFSFLIEALKLVGIISEFIYIWTSVTSITCWVLCTVQTNWWREDHRCQAWRLGRQGRQEPSTVAWWSSEGAWLRGMESGRLKERLTTRQRRDSDMGPVHRVWYQWSASLDSRKHVWFIPQLGTAWASPL